MVIQLTKRKRKIENMNIFGQTLIYIWAVAMLVIFISAIIFVVWSIKKKERKTIKRILISAIIVAIAISYPVIKKTISSKRNQYLRQKGGKVNAHH